MRTGESAAPLLSSKLIAGMMGIAAAGLHVSRHRLVLGDRAAADWLYRRSAGLDPLRSHAGCARNAPVVGQQATRELRWRHELRNFPDVLRLVRALSLVACARRQPLLGRST